MKYLQHLLLAAVLVGPAAFTEAQTPAAVSVKVDKDHADFFVGKEMVTRYHIEADTPFPFFEPLKTLDGTATTSDAPSDHPHHHSAWFTHGDVIPEGMEIKTKKKGVAGVDFWSGAKANGKIVCTKMALEKTTHDQAKLVTHNEWRTVEGDKVLDETRNIYFYLLGKAYLIVLDIDLYAGVWPITFGDTKEGSMGIRILQDINVKSGKGKMENAEGMINEKQCWGYKSGWCDYSGKVGNSVAGVAIFDYPANPSPACWHARDYGLMAANPFGRDKAAFPGVKGDKQLVRLAKGEHLRLRYGLLVHAGDATQGQVATLFQQFVKLRETEK
jgi:hypothetical protein